MTRRLLVSQFPALLVACALAAPANGAGPPGRIVSVEHNPITGKSTRTEYSEYFEFDNPILGGRVRMHLLLTLGSERLPSGWRFQPGPWTSSFITSDGQLTKRARKDGIIEQVYEIYFTNLSDTPVTFSPIELEVRPLGRVPLFPSPMTLEPRQFLKTEPIVELGSIYQPTQKDFKVRYTFEGRQEEVAGVVQRLRVDELGRQ